MTQEEKDVLIAQAEAKVAACQVAEKAAKAGVVAAQGVAAQKLAQWQAIQAQADAAKAVLDGANQGVLDAKTVENNANNDLWLATSGYEAAQRIPVQVMV